MTTEQFEALRAWIESERQFVFLNGVRAGTPERLAEAQQQINDAREAARAALVQ